MVEKKSPKKTSAKPKKQRSKLSEGVIIAFIGLVGTIIAGLLGSPLIDKWLSPVLTPTKSATATVIAVQTINSSQTVEPSQTSTVPLLVFNPHPDPSDYIDSLGVPMHLVPADAFIMGSDNGEDNEKPAHTIYLSTYYIDKYEVTNALYEACLTVGVCDLPRETSTPNILNYCISSEFDDYPVVNVDWFQAKVYCEWRGAQLPSEAQWEKAARGIDGRTYPWGEGIDCLKANYDDCVNNPTKVGSYEGGRSPYAIYDMAGNVWEWVSSLDYPYPYIPTDGREDLTIPGKRQIRGGPWYTPVSGEILVRSFARSWYYQTDFAYWLGFRCAKNVTP